MTEDTLHALFEKHNGEYLKFDRVEKKRSNRPDLHAFLLLDELSPDAADIVAAAEHDEIFLDVTPGLLFQQANEEQIVELIRCGLRYDRSLDSLCMFV